MSTWHAHVRIESNGEYAEYNDTIGVASIDGQEPTTRDIEEEVKRMIVDRSPQMKSGRVTKCSIRRIS